LASNFINEPQSAVVQTSHLRGVRRVLLSDPGSLTAAFKVSFKPWPVAVVAWMACIEDSSPAVTFSMFQLNRYNQKAPWAWLCRNTVL